MYTVVPAPVAQSQILLSQDTGVVPSVLHLLEIMETSPQSHAA